MRRTAKRSKTGLVSPTENAPADNGAVRLLLVEDNPDDVQLFEVLLRQAGWRNFVMVVASRVDEALEYLAQDRFDALVLDLSLPDAHGLSAVERLQQIIPDMPVVVWSGLRDEALALQIIQSGAQDYMVKGQGDGATVARAVRYAIERKRMQSYLAHLARYDQLTSLPNRSLFRDRLSQAVRRAERSGKMLAVLYLDLDRFKEINDSLGHTAGDELLKVVAKRLEGCVRQVDTVARLGGDEFTVILEGLTLGEHCAPIAQKIINRVVMAVMVQDTEVRCSTSVGIAIFPRDGADADTLIRNADVAMYQAKNNGRSTFQFYESRMNARAYDRLTMQNALRQALERDELMLHYQPVRSIADDMVTGVEALLRWRHPERGLILPAEFIGLMEESGLMVPAGEWILRSACSQYQAWRNAGAPPFRLNVNLSARQLWHKDFTGMVERVLADTGVAGRMLTLELTESTLMDNTATTQNALQALHDMGVSVSVDDFGTGYSSLAYLKRFKIDRLKIDRSFVCDVTTDADSAAIVTAIISLAHNLRINVTAEGVETPEQLAFLKANGCDDAQGFLFSEVLPPESIIKFLADT